MENGIYVRAHPTIVSLLLDDIKGAIWFAQIVDNGADYLHLLETYKAMGFVIKPAIKNEIATGNYKQALEIPSTTQHDFFIKGLLYYSTTNEVPRDKIDLILKDMEPGLLKELLQHLTI
jgi:hypothetical protein